MSTNAVVEKLFVAQVSKTADPAETIEVTLDFDSENEFSWTSVFDGNLKPDDAYRITISNGGATGVRVGPKGANSAKFPFEISANSAAVLPYTLQANDGLLLATAEDSTELSVNLMVSRLLS